MKALLFAWLFLTGCTGDPPLPGLVDSAQSMHSQSSENATYHIASDENLLLRTLILADRKGTLKIALTKAAEDSTFGIKLREILLLADNATILTAQTSAAQWVGKFRKNKKDIPKKKENVHGSAPSKGQISNTSWTNSRRSAP